ncbi:MFS transporter, partial [Candidatus Jorgensenbacteria bacterium]|nr:MFS transporter [Candidatus Jorgensenbacteria bacterium]
MKILGIERNVFFLGLISLFNDFSAEMVQSVMPVFLTSVLGAPALFVGLIEGVADALASFLKIFSGWLSDRINRRKLPAVLGYAFSLGARSFLVGVSTFWQVFGLRIIDRIGKGLRNPPRDALIAESVSKEELGKSFGFHRMMDTVGATVGPLVAFALLPFFNNDFRKIFLIAFVVGLFAIFSFAFVKETKKVTEQQKKPVKLNIQLLKAHKPFLIFLLATFVFDLGALPISLVLLRTQEIGLGLQAVPFFYFLFSLVFVIGAVPLGRLSDKIGQRTVIIGGFIAATLAYVGFAILDTTLGLVLAFSVLGIHGAATDGVRRALASKLVDHS